MCFPNVLKFYAGIVKNILRFVQAYVRSKWLKDSCHKRLLTIIDVQKIIIHTYKNSYMGYLLLLLKVAKCEI